MHTLLAHIHHLVLFAAHIVLHPIWRAPAAGLVVAVGGRLAGFTRRPRSAATVACVALACGWALLDVQALGWPLAPVARLPGLALVLLAEAIWRGGAARWRLLVLPVSAALGAWWLRGAPLTGPAILNCMPVFLGLWAGIAVARRLARGDGGLRGALAAGALAAALLLTGAAAHWAQAAVVVAMVALGLADGGGALAAAVVMVAAAAIVASDRGRLVPVDMACLAPVGVWVVWRK